jgi:predicted DNA-binding transcriptional regulator AlpA
MVQHDENTAPTRRLIKGYKGLGKKNGRSRSQNWRDVRGGKIPPPVEIGPNAVAWFEDEIDACYASRPRRTYRATLSPTPDTAAPIVPEPALNPQVPKHDAAERTTRRARNIHGRRDA